MPFPIQRIQTDRGREFFAETVQQRLMDLERPRNALGSKTLIDRICELMAKIPSGEAVERTYDPAKERIHVADYAIDSTLARVK